MCKLTKADMLKIKKQIFFFKYYFMLKLLVYLFLTFYVYYLVTTYTLVTATNIWDLWLILIAVNILVNIDSFYVFKRSYEIDKLLNRYSVINKDTKQAEVICLKILSFLLIKSYTNNKVDIKECED